MTLATSLVKSSYSDTAATSITFTAITPASGGLVLLATLTHDNEGSPEVPVVTGTGWASGLTWTQEATITGTHAAGGVGRYTLFSATCPDSPSTGTIILTTSATHEKFAYYLILFTGTDTPTVVQAKGELEAGDGSSAFVTSPTAGNAVGVIGVVAYNASTTGYVNAWGTNYGETTGWTYGRPYVGNGGYNLSSLTDPITTNQNTESSTHLVLIFEVSEPSQPFSKLARYKILTPNIRSF